MQKRSFVFASAFAITVLTEGSAAALPPARQGKPKTAAAAAPTAIAPTVAPLTQTQRILHVLNRLGYGPRPGDVARVRGMGLAAYLDQQLAPEDRDDSAVEEKLAALPVLRQSQIALSSSYDHWQKEAYRLEKLRSGLETALAEKDRPKTAATITLASASSAPPMTMSQTEESGSQESMAAMTPMTAMTPGVSAMSALSADNDASVMTARRLSAAATRAETMTREAEMQRYDQEARQARREADRTFTAANSQLTAARIVRAVESQRQLQEVLVDFWSNHFNIDVRKGDTRSYLMTYDRDTIRPFVLGRFRDLLGATAKSPAMLVYLDNAQSTGEQAQTAAADPRQQRRVALMEKRLEQMAAGGDADAKEKLTRFQTAKKRKPSGLNENYAREIMELHTLGVDGGYTQKDVTEVARCLTGWTIDRPTGTFKFDARRHDTGAKTVLGQSIGAGGGIEDGEKVLDILSSHPATMRHVSYQLCQRLVADEPPASLVNKCIATWERTGGNLRSVVRTIVTAPEFYAPATYKGKYKSPLEFVASAIRAQNGTIPLGANSDSKPAANPAERAQSVLNQVALLGQGLYQYQAPTGYPEDSRKWVSSGAVIGRLNFALSLSSSRIGGVLIPAPETLSSNGDSAPGIPLAPLVERLISACVNDDLSSRTRAALLRQFPESATDAPRTPQEQRKEAQQILTLLIGSPDFQNH